MSNSFVIDSLEKYQQLKNKSENLPEEFWEDIAVNNFVWQKPFSKVLNFDLTVPRISWFEDGELNITENCIDRHLEKSGDKIAIIFEANNPEEPTKKISYKELHQEVCKMANVLKQKGVKKGDRVCLYMPMIPELAYSMLACARIGAIHSIVFAGFSSTALASRINDCESKVIITADGAFRGAKTLNLKGIVDDALMHCKNVETVLVVKRTGEKINMASERDTWLAPLLEKASADCPLEIMNAEDPLFILYTSGSTGKPKGMVHSTAGYMIYTAFTFKNVFQYNKGDIYFCSADIGWITGHSYIVYGPLANGATSLMFEGVPSYPDFGRFWEIIDKHKVNQFYTAPTAIRSLAKQSLDILKPYDLSSLKVLGTVGEPINEEAWDWYKENIGKNNCPIVDTWWQTETGGIMISNLADVTPEKATYATLPIPGIQACLVDDNGKEIEKNNVEGKLCIKSPWPSMARTIWGDHERYKNTYFSAYTGKYFTGDGAFRDQDGNYRITGRVDDVIIVSGHNLGTAPIEDAVDEHEDVSEAAVVGYPHDIKGNALFGYVCLKNKIGNDELKKEINNQISKQIGPIAKLDKVLFVESLPKTRSGKIIRRILRKIASNDTSNLGDTSTLLNPDCVEDIMTAFKEMDS